MEILIGAVSSLLIQLYKRVKKCYGEKVVDEVIYFGLFIIALMWVGLTKELVVSIETVRSIVEIVLIGVGVYEVLIKRLRRIFGLEKRI
jgi:hypothetical protein